MTEATVLATPPSTKSDAAWMPKTGAVTSLVLEKFFDATTLLLLLGLVSLLVELPAPLAGVRRRLAAAMVAGYLSAGVRHSDCAGNANRRLRAPDLVSL